VTNSPDEPNRSPGGIVPEIDHDSGGDELSGESPKTTPAIAEPEVTV
jgi:hypothetical protein